MTGATGRWEVLPVTPNDVHVHPLADLTAHDTTTDACVCGPRVEPVPRVDGTIGWVSVHHSLDGRECREQAA